jgi:hypothetical protein
MNVMLLETGRGQRRETLGHAATELGDYDYDVRYKGRVTVSTRGAGHIYVS